MNKKSLFILEIILIVSLLSIAIILGINAIFGAQKEYLLYFPYDQSCELKEVQVKPYVDNYFQYNHQLEDSPRIKILYHDMYFDIPLEEYIVGVIANEMGPTWPQEALKAQSIAARTYALHYLETHDYIEVSEQTQTYISKSEMQEQYGSKFEEYYTNLKNAVLDTYGKQMYYDDSLIDAVYFSTSSGITYSSDEIWGHTHPYLISKASPWDQEYSNAYKQEVVISESNFIQSLNDINHSNFTEINSIIPRYENNYGLLNYIYINGDYSNAYTRNDIVAAFGLRSGMFNIYQQGKNIVFVVYGYGHNVGMSQFGAYGMAMEGYNYLEILHYYYTDVEIKGD